MRKYIERITEISLVAAAIWWVGLPIGRVLIDDLRGRHNNPVELIDDNLWEAVEIKKAREDAEIVKDAYWNNRAYCEKNYPHRKLECEIIAQVCAIGKINKVARCECTQDKVDRHYNWLKTGVSMVDLCKFGSSNWDARIRWDEPWRKDYFGWLQEEGHIDSNLSYHRAEGKTNFVAMMRAHEVTLDRPELLTEYCNDLYGSETDFGGSGRGFEQVDVDSIFTCH